MGHKLHKEHSLQSGTVVEHRVELLVVGGLGAGGRRGGRGASDIAATKHTWTSPEETDTCYCNPQSFNLTNLTQTQSLEKYYHVIIKCNSSKRESSLFTLQT